MKNNKTITLECILTGEQIKMSEGLFDKRIKGVYGNEENLKKYIVTFKILKLIKKGHDFDEISTMLKIDRNPPSKPLLDEALSFYRNTFKERGRVLLDSTATQYETDEDVKEWISSMKKINQQHTKIENK